MTGEWTGKPAPTPHAAPAGAGEASGAASEPGRALAVAPTVGTALTRDASGRFITGNNGGGRPKGSRNRLKEIVLARLVEHFDKHGEAVLDRLAAEQPAEYVRAVTALLPREHPEPDNYGDLSDDETAELIERAERGRRVRKIIEAIEK